MSSIWRIPPSAFFLFILTLCGALGVGTWVGVWILPIAVAFSHGGWSEVCRIPISERIFAEVPAFLDSDSLIYKAVNVGRILLALGGAAVFGVVGRRWWEHIVIDKYGWMTREEVNAFYKRSL